MAADLTVFDGTNDALELVELGEVHLTDSVDAFMEGEPHRYGVKNTGTTNLRHIEVGIAGDDAAYVQLALDNDGEPHDFLAPGSEIALSGEKTFFRDEVMYFWMRPVYSPADAEGRKNFKIVFSAESF